MTEQEKRTLEYDRFGPWVYEITGPDEVPAAFESAVHLGSNTRMAFKIPRQVERRTVRPEDDLYTQVIVLGETDVSIHELAGTGVDTTTVAYRDLVAVSSLHDLLYGELRLYADGSPISISYNTVSDHLIQSAIDVIRTARRQAVGPAAVDAPFTRAPDAVAEGKMEHLFGGLVHQERRAHPVVVRAYEPAGVLEKRDPRVTERLLDLIRRERRRPVLILETPEGLVIYHGAPQVTRFGRGNYGYQRTELWDATVAQAIMEEDDRYVASRRVHLSAGGHHFEYNVSEGFELAG